jgi:hypothetical protein
LPALIVQIAKMSDRDQSPPTEDEASEQMNVKVTDGNNETVSQEHVAPVTKATIIETVLLERLSGPLKQEITASILVFFEQSSLTHTSRCL